MAKIKSTVEGFLKDMAYTAHLPMALKPFEDKFRDAETIEVSLREIPYTMIGQPTGNGIVISDDGKKVSINYTTWKLYDKKGKPTSTSSQQEVFGELKYMMEKAVAEYAEKFQQ